MQVLRMVVNVGYNIVMENDSHCHELTRVCFAYLLVIAFMSEQVHALQVGLQP